jgi:DNA-directed RNA polymerase specialized sigma24 family protein
MSHSIPDRAVARTAAALLCRLDELTEQLVVRINSDIDFYRIGEVVSRAELNRSVGQNLSYILGQLAGTEPRDLSAPRHTGQLRADAGAPLPEVLRAYRLGFAFVWASLLAESPRPSKGSLDALLNAASDVWALADDYSIALTEAYRGAVARQVVSADRRRSALVAALLRGPASDSRTTWEIAQLLDMPYRGSFLVVVAEAAAIGSVSLPGIEDRLGVLGVASAWRMQPDFEVGVLSCPRRRTPNEVIDALRGAATARVGISPAYCRLEDTPRALRFARAALESMPEERADVRQFDDTPLAELAMGSMDTTRRVVRRVLGNVLCLPEDERTTLLDTAAAWLSAGGSARDAARTLYCHENTVRYRMRRLEERLGHDLANPTTMAELAAALSAVRMFPGLAGESASEFADVPQPPISSAELLITNRRRPARRSSA